MLSKLMKHEFRATGRIMLPLFLLVLVSAVFANLSSRVLLNSDYDFINLLGILLMTVFVLAIMAMCIMAFVLMIQRFYKSLLQDEGYVMMTLPVSVHQQVWSKLLVGVVWCVVTAIAVGTALVILVLDLDMLEGIRRFGGEVWALLRSEYGFDGVLATYPVQGLTLDFAVGSGHSAAAVGVVGTLDFRDVPVGILCATGTHYDVCVLQAYFLAGRQAHELLFCLFLEVVAFNP